MKRSHLIWFLLILALAASSCGSDSEPATTLPPEPDIVLDVGAEAMGAVEYVRFKIERGGAPVYIDPLDTLNFALAEGQFAAPSSANAVVTLAVGNINAQIGAIAIDGKTWLTNPITGKWDEAPSGYDFDPATLFDPELGWRPLLAEGLTDIVWIGEETRNSEARYHIRAVADEDRVLLILAGLIRKQAVDLDMWIDPETGYVREAELSTVYEGQTSDWYIEFSEFDVPIEIAPPDIES
ncbi:MAG: LppX_LprAFG lipoprotein [Acidimicrobiia bacterium]|nr:LppX_LprAFG lipoprotein [Acidimicrobiia bacterium]MDX2467076.1 LppX_LprAFG lipoprotein [Acidimicrobiia bacterium]